MKKILTVSIILLVLTMVGCGSNNVVVEQPKQEEKPLKKEINVVEYEKADFVNLNKLDNEYNKLLGTKVFIEGNVDSVDLEGKVFAKSPNLSLSQKEGEGFGIYAVTGFEIKDSVPDIKEGDVVKAYGLITLKEKLGFPTIIVDKIEIVK